MFCDFFKRASLITKNHLYHIKSKKFHVGLKMILHRILCKWRQKYLRKKLLGQKTWFRNNKQANISWKTNTKILQMRQGICLQILNYFLGKNVLISSIISNYEFSFTIFLLYALLLQVFLYGHFMLIVIFFLQLRVFFFISLETLLEESNCDYIYKQLP